ncbi:oligosaccharide flippase family protein, partial [Lactovum odontotermitis]
MKRVKNFFYMSFYQILAIILPIITAPYASRVLGVKGVGINNFTNSITSYFLLFAALGTWVYGSREIAYVQNDKKKRSQVFWGINFLSWLTSSISLIVFLIFVALAHDYQTIYLWQGIAILTVFFDISWYFSGRENFRAISLRSTVTRIISVILLFIFVHKPSDLWIYVATLVLPSFVSALTFWPILLKEVDKPDICNLELFKHLRKTIVMFLPTQLTNFYLMFGVSMVGILDSVDHSGLFTQANTLIRLPLSIISAIGFAMLPHVANLFSEKNIIGIKKAILQSFNVSTGLAVGLFFGILAISLKFGSFFYGKGFEETGILMMIISPIILFLVWSNVFGYQYMLPLDLMKEFTISIVAGTFINVLFNLVMIPVFGVIGAAVTTVISELIISCIEWYFIRKTFYLRDLFHGIW